MAKEEKIQLIHPQGKKAPALSFDKYKPLEKAIISIIKSEKQITHTDLFLALNDYFVKKKIQFDGSVNWYGEWVKLHLLATGKILVQTKKSKKIISLNKS